MTVSAALEVTNPATGVAIGSVPVSTPDDVRRAVAAAKAAALAWSARPIHERVGLVRLLAATVRNRTSELGPLLRSEVGRKVAGEATGEVEACARLLEGYADEALHGPWQSVPGDVQPGLGEALVESDVDIVSFTGSAAVGVEVATKRTPLLTPTLLELGRPDAAIVLDDADVALAVDSILFARLLVTSQCCCATKRVIVTPGIGGGLTEEARLCKERLGDPADACAIVGPLIPRGTATDASSHIGAAVSHGSRLVLAGGIADGTFLEPAVLASMPPDSETATTQEVFAPVIPVVEASSVDHPVSIANASPYGLNAAVFGEDTRRALGVARRVEAGSIAVNGAGLFRVDAAPCGGIKLSGLGRKGCLTSKNEMTRPKSINLRGYWR